MASRKRENEDSLVENDNGAAAFISSAATNNEEPPKKMKVNQNSDENKSSIPSIQDIIEHGDIREVWEKIFNHIVRLEQRKLERLNDIGCISEYCCNETEPFGAIRDNVNWPAHYTWKDKVFNHKDFIYRGFDAKLGHFELHNYAKKSTEDKEEFIKLLSFAHTLKLSGEYCSDASQFIDEAFLREPVCGKWIKDIGSHSFKVKAESIESEIESSLNVEEYLQFIRLTSSENWKVVAVDYRDKDEPIGKVWFIISTILSQPTLDHFSLEFGEFEESYSRKVLNPDYMKRVESTVEKLDLVVFFPPGNLALPWELVNFSELKKLTLYVTFDRLKGDNSIENFDIRGLFTTPNFETHVICEYFDMESVKTLMKVLRDQNPNGKIILYSDEDLYIKRKRNNEDVVLFLNETYFRENTSWKDLANKIFDPSVLYSTLVEVENAPVVRLSYGGIAKKSTHRMAPRNPVRTKKVQRLDGKIDLTEIASLANEFDIDLAIPTISLEFPGAPVQLANGLWTTRPLEKSLLDLVVETFHKEVASAIIEMNTIKRISFYSDAQFREDKRFWGTAEVNQSLDTKMKEFRYVHPVQFIDFF